MQRITAVGNVYYLSDDETSEVTARFTRLVESTEQIYSRRLKLTEEWKPLDTGWLQSCSMLSVENTTRVGAVHHKPAKLSRDAEGIIELSYAEDPRQSFLIPPGETYFVLPANVTGLFIRCGKGSATAMLNLIPE